MTEDPFESNSEPLSTDMRHPSEKDGIKVGDTFYYTKNDGTIEKVVVKQINVFKEDGVEKTTYTINKVKNPVGGGWGVTRDRLIKEDKEENEPQGPSEPQEPSEPKEPKDENNLPKPSKPITPITPPTHQTIGWIQPLIALIVTILLIIFLKITGVINNIPMWATLFIILIVNVILAKFTEKLEMRYREELEKKKKYGIKGLFSFDMETIISVLIILIFFGYFESVLTTVILGPKEIFILLVFTLIFFFRYHIANILRWIYYKILQKSLEFAKNKEKQGLQKFLLVFHEEWIKIIIKLLFSWVITYLVLYKWFGKPILTFIILNLILAIILWKAWGAIMFIPLLIYLFGTFYNFNLSPLVLPYLIIIGFIVFCFSIFHSLKIHKITITPKAFFITLILIVLLLGGSMTYTYSTGTGPFKEGGVFNKLSSQTQTKSTDKSVFGGTEERWSIITNFKEFFNSNLELMSSDSVEARINKDDYTHVIFSDIFGQSNVEMYNSNEIMVDVSIDSTSQVKEYSATVECFVYDYENKMITEGKVYPEKEIILNFIPQTITCAIPGEKLNKVGEYRAEFIVNVKNLTTTSILSNQFLDGVYLTNKLSDIALKNNLRFSNNEDYLRTIAFAFPYVASKRPVSISTDGPITLALESGKMPINSFPYKGMDNSLKIGLTNNDEGTIDKINTFKLYLPKDFELTSLNQNSEDKESTQFKKIKSDVDNYILYEFSNETKRSIVNSLTTLSRNKAKNTFTRTTLLDSSNGIIKTFFYNSVLGELKPNKYLETQRNFITFIKYNYKARKTFSFQVTYDPIFASFTNPYQGQKFPASNWPVPISLTTDALGTGFITSYYSLRDGSGISNIASNYHGGIDIGAQKGTEVRSISGGIVTEAMGTRVAVVTNDKKIRISYAHIIPSVSKGQNINAGDVIGTTDSLNHVHVAFSASGVQTKDKALELFGEGHVARANDDIGKYKGEEVYAILYSESAYPSLNIACLFDENFIKSRTKSNQVYARHSLVTTPFVGCDVYEKFRLAGKLFSGEFSTD